MEWECMARPQERSVQAVLASTGLLSEKLKLRKVRELLSFQFLERTEQKALNLSQMSNQ